MLVSAQIKYFNMFILCCFLHIFYCYNLTFAANITYNDNNIFLDGEISKGDAKKIHTIIEQIFSTGNYDYAVVDFNSPAGNFSEALEIGYLLYEKHVSTSVKKGNMCVGACALAFLGGRDINSHPSRQLAFGATLAFNSFSSLGNSVIPSLIYFSKLHIDLNFVISSLTNNKEPYFIVNTPKSIEAFDINLNEKPILFDKNVYSKQAKFVALNNLFKLNIDDWDIQDVNVFHISDKQFKYEMISYYNNGPISNTRPLHMIIENTLSMKNPNKINLIYKELESFDLVPKISDYSKDIEIFKVTGLDNVHHYLSKIGYVIIINNYTENMHLICVLAPPTDIGGKIIIKAHYSSSEFCSWIYDPNEKLW